MILTLLLCLDAVVTLLACYGLLYNGNSNFSDYCAIFGTFGSAFLTCFIATLVIVGALHV